MLDSIYGFLAKIGYGHPLHPAVVHMPIGMVIGALVLALTALIWRKNQLGLSAHHVFIAALIFYFPAVLSGVMDWRHFYGGAWMTTIKIKVALAVILLPLLLIGYFWGRKSEEHPVRLVVIYVLCVIMAIGLGFYGANLVYGAAPAAVPSEQPNAEQVYQANCAGCHPQGGNSIAPELPVKGSKFLKSSSDFSAFLRKPLKSDGSTGAMPAYPPETLSDSQVDELYKYIMKTFPN